MSNMAEARGNGRRSRERIFPGDVVKTRTPSLSDLDQQHALPVGVGSRQAMAGNHTIDGKYKNPPGRAAEVKHDSRTYRRDPGRPGKNRWGPAMTWRREIRHSPNVPSVGGFVSYLDRMLTTISATLPGFRTEHRVVTR